MITNLKKLILNKPFFWATINAVLLLPFYLAKASSHSSEPYNVPPEEFINPLGKTDIKGLIGKIADIVFQVGFLVAAVFLILSGMKFVTARGNPEELEKAKKMFMWTIIGAAVLLGATVIVEAVKATVESLKG